MAELVVGKRMDDCYSLANRLVFEKGSERPSARGDTKWIPNLLVVAMDPTPVLSQHAPHDEFALDSPNEAWSFMNDEGRWETYTDRMRNPVDQISEGIRMIKAAPYTRRFSISISRPWDIRSSLSPSLMELSVQVVREKKAAVHLTGFFRSVDVYNFLNLNLAGLSEIQRRICEETGYGRGTIAAMIANAHYYVKDEDEVGRIRDGESGECRDAGLIECDHIPFGWRRTLEHVFTQGYEEETQWGEEFEGYAKAKYAHRLIVDISSPLEDMMDEKAPFTREYGEEYAMRYVIGTTSVPASKDEIVICEDEAYTYASRARWAEEDRKFGVEPVDQLAEAINLLRKDRYTRRAAVTISRPWDISSRDPPCLRAYVLQAIDESTLGGTFYMRSNDAYGATHANQYGFARLVQFVAQQCGFEKVRMTLLAMNMHIYSNSWNAVREILWPKTPSAGERMLKGR